MYLLQHPLPLAASPPATCLIWQYLPHMVIWQDTLVEDVQEALECGCLCPIKTVYSTLRDKGPPPLKRGAHQEKIRKGVLTPIRHIPTKRSQTEASRVARSGCQRALVGVLEAGTTLDDLILVILLI